MKKILLIATILFVAVVSTACINNLAVQDLNNKAQTYLEQGDYKQAIERLKSSLDLDANVFETHYNLAIAYSKNENYIEAINEYQKALELKPNFSQIYYSLATTQYNVALDIEKANLAVDENGNLYKPNKEEYVPEKGEVEMEVQLAPKEFDYMNKMYSDSLSNYTKYLELNPNAKEKEEIEKQINKISEILKYNNVN